MPELILTEPENINHMMSKDNNKSYFCGILNPIIMPVVPREYEAQVNNLGYRTAGTLENISKDDFGFSSTSLISGPLLFPAGRICEENSDAMNTFSRLINNIDLNINRKRLIDGKDIIKVLSDYELLSGELYLLRHTSKLKTASMRNTTRALLVSDNDIVSINDNKIYVNDSEINLDPHFMMNCLKDNRLTINSVIKISDKVVVTKNTLHDIQPPILRFFDDQSDIKYTLEPNNAVINND